MRSSILVAVGALSALLSIAALAAAPAPAPSAPAKAPTAEDIAFFEKEVRPVLAQQCYSCHGPKAKQSGLRLDSREWLVKGGARGTALVPGDPEKSSLIWAVKHTHNLQMPPGEKLPEKQVAALEKWVKMGAPWPSAGQPAVKTAQSWEEVLKQRADWWSLKPVRRYPVPPVKNAKWSAHPVDRFLLSALEKKGLAPAAKTDKRTLIRRLSLTLTGLLPTPEEIETFVNDKSPDAYEKLVDRTLASPHFGECWARHWMDVVRFGETCGYEWNYEIRDAWRYRDYLIRAFNEDLPYDQFIREHIAGDLLPNPRWDKETGLNDSVTGTAFFRFGENGHDVFKEIGLDVLDNQIDTLSKAFQATTVTCARCHDHKLDAVSQKDYYGLLGILVSSRQVVQTLDSPKLYASKEARLAELKGQIKTELASAWQKQAGEARRYLRAAQAARAKSADAATLAQGLDPKRLQAFVTALEKRKPGMEDPLNAWATAAEAKDVPAAWKDLAAKYEQEAKARAEFNQKNFTVLGDFQHGVTKDWRIAGLGLQKGPTGPGEFSVAMIGEKAVTGIFPSGLFTNTISDKLDGAAQSPWLPRDRKFVSMQVTGTRGGVMRMIPDHRQLTDTGKELPKDGLQWITVGRSDRDEWLYLELITKMHNARYMGDEDQDARSAFGVTKVVLSDRGEAPKDDLAREQRLVRGPEPKSLDDVASRYSTALTDALSRWTQGKANDEDAEWLDWAWRSGVLTNSNELSPKLTELVNQYRMAEKEITPPRVVAGVADQDSGFDVPVYLRGDFRTPGDTAHRRFLEVLTGHEQPISRGSGRWDLAEHIANPNNPLTARVMVNRVWHHLFGTGIVRTVDDFGHMGEPPSHPELLDYLASCFSATETPSKKPGTFRAQTIGFTKEPAPASDPSPKLGWSLKKLIKFLVMTQAFQMSGQDDPKGKVLDAENRLLHHFPSRRMEAEMIRDGILETSGRLDPKLYGPSIQPHRVTPSPERRLYQGPLDGDGRRSVYIKITLMEGPRFLDVFNLPDPKVAQGRRDVTNVPAQALTLMNDPFVIGQADFWAGKLIERTDASVGARIDYMFRTALSRPPTKSETERFEAAVKELGTLQNVPEADVLKNRALWKDMAHAVFNLKEFIYIR